MWNTLKSFYNSQKWKDCRLNVISQRMLDGIIKCEICNKVILKSGECEVHHKKELTLENVNDFHTSLNPDNLIVVCKSCHNQKHNRFGNNKEHNVYILHGAPFAGKKTYVKNNMSRGDIIVDMDLLYQALSFQCLYDKPEVLKSNIFSVRKTLLDNVKTRYGKWNSAWIVGGFSNLHDLHYVAEQLGADIIEVNTPKDVCLKRLEFCKDYRGLIKAEYKKYIDEWFEKFS